MFEKLTICPWRKTRQPDPEAQPLALDYSDEKWPIKHHSGNIINIVGFSDPEKDNAELSARKWSYRVNIAELQRMHLRQLQRRIVDHAVTIALSRRESSGWIRDIRAYGMLDNDMNSRRTDNTLLLT